jgi:hypothetical protein
MRPEELLILNYPRFSERAISLFKELAASPAARKLFIKNPVGVVGYSVFPESQLPGTAELNQANRLFFALLSNPKFMEWAEKFQVELETQAKAEANDNLAEGDKMLTVDLDRSKIYTEIIKAVRDHGDLEILYSLLVQDTEARAASPRMLGPVLVSAFVVAIDVAVVFRLVLRTEYYLRFKDPSLNREDVLKISELLVAKLNERAERLRKQGSLTSFEVTRRGSDL